MTVHRAFSYTFSGPNGASPPTWLSSRVILQGPGLITFKPNDSTIQQTAQFPTGAFYQIWESAGALLQYFYHWISGVVFSPAKYIEIRYLFATSYAAINPILFIRRGNPTPPGGYWAGPIASYVGVMRWWIGGSKGNPNLSHVEPIMQDTHNPYPQQIWSPPNTSTFPGDNVPTWIALRLRAATDEATGRYTFYTQVKWWDAASAEPAWPVTYPTGPATAFAYSVPIIDPAPYNDRWYIKQRGTIGFGMYSPASTTVTYQVRTIIAMSYDYDTNVGAIGPGPGDP